MKLTYNHTMKSCFLAYMTSAVLNNTLPLLFLTLQRSFGITVAQLGFLVTFNFGVQMVVDFIGAKYADSWGYRATIITALAMSVLGFCALATLPFLIDPYMGLVCAVCTYAVGSGLLEVIVSPITEALPSHNKEAAMSLLHSFYCWGHLVCVLLSTAFFIIIGIESWRYLIFAWALLPFVTMLLFTRVPIRSLDASKGERISLMSLYKQKGFILFFAIMVCSGAAEQAMAQWVSYFAEEGLRVSKTLGDLLGASMFALCMAIGRMIYSKNAERLNLRRYLIVCALVVTLAFVGASIVKAPVLALVCCGVCGVAVAIMWPGTLSLATQTIPGKSTAMFAMLAVGGDIGCTVGPEAVAIGASLFTIHGSAIKAGMICAVIFPVLLALLVKLTSIKRVSQ